MIHLFNLHNKASTGWDWLFERLMLVLPIWLVMVMGCIYGTTIMFHVDINHLDHFKGDVASVNLMLIMSLVIPTLIFAIDLPVSYYLEKRKAKGQYISTELSRENLN